MVIFYLCLPTQRLPCNSLPVVEQTALCPAHRLPLPPHRLRWLHWWFWWDKISALLTREISPLPGLRFVGYANSLGEKFITKLAAPPPDSTQITRSKQKLCWPIRENTLLLTDKFILTEFDHVINPNVILRKIRKMRK